MGSALVNGVELAYDEAGNGDVVLFHPGTASSRRP